jgi:hypothetical protein
MPFFFIYFVVADPAYSIRLALYKLKSLFEKKKEREEEKKNREVAEE